MNVATSFFDGVGKQQSGQVSKTRYEESMEVMNELQKTHGGGTSTPVPFQKLEVQVQDAFGHCDVVLQMPYIAPMADMLVYVNFNSNEGGDSRTDNILMSSCC